MTTAGCNVPTMPTGARVHFAPRGRVILGSGDRGVPAGWTGVVERVADGVAVVAHEPEDCGCHLEPRARDEQPLHDCPRCSGLGVARRRLLPVWTLELDGGATCPA